MTKEEMIQKGAKPEIERRFLLRNTKNLDHLPNIKKISISQYYTPEGRIRCCDFGGSSRIYYLTIKIDNGYANNLEYEEEIDSNKFNFLKETSVKSIHKNRYIYVENGLKWEIDHIEDPKLGILEVELNDINQDIEIPDFLKSLILFEITNDKKFSNYNLAR
jgi:CYTH domain-containing protein